MRKILSLVLTVCMLFSMTAMVLAEDKQTTIRYVADGTSSYEVTVPSLMAPGETKQVTLEGTWTTEEKVVVSAPNSVVLTNDIDGDTEELAVTFNGLEVVGNNRESISLSEDVAVASMPGDVIFGTWEGIVTYSVSVEDAIELISFTILNKETDYQVYEAVVYQAEEGMTWEEWVNSEYNTDGFVLTGEYITSLEGHDTKQINYNGGNFVSMLDSIISNEEYSLGIYTE